MTNPSARYISAIARNLAELQRAIHNRDAMQAIEAERASGHSFFRIAYLALYNDYMAHAIKIYENSTRVASFWYLYRTDQGLIDKFSKSSDIDISSILKLSTKLKTIRNSTHFHIDANTVGDTKAIWKSANIKGSELSKSIDDTWQIVSHLQRHYKLPAIDLLPEMAKVLLRRQIRSGITYNT